MVAKTQVHRHFETVGNDLGIVETGRILEIKVIVRRRIIVEIIADQKHLLDGRVK